MGLQYEDMTKVKGFDRNLPASESWKLYARDHTELYPEEKF